MVMTDDIALSNSINMGNHYFLTTTSPPPLQHNSTGPFLREILKASEEIVKLVKRLDIQLKIANQYLFLHIYTCQLKGSTRRNKDQTVNC